MGTFDDSPFDMRKPEDDRERGTLEKPRLIEDGNLEIPEPDELEPYSSASGDHMITDSFIYDGSQYVVVHWDNDAPSDAIGYVYLYGDEDEIEELIQDS